MSELPPGTTWADLRAGALRAARTNGHAHVPGGSAPADGVDTPYGVKALASECDIVASTHEGGRNAALNTAWYRMGRIIAGGNLSMQTARAALADAGRRTGLPEHEISLILRDDSTSGVAAGSAQPRVPDAASLEPITEATLFVDPELDADTRAAAVRSRFPLVDWHELWSREHVEEWIVEPILPARRLVALYSAPKLGKSLLMLEIAVGVARGVETIGATDGRKRRVLYVDFENDPRGDIYERLSDMGMTPDVLDDLCYLSYPSLQKLDTAAGASELLAIIAEYGCEVVIIDTISRAVGGEENDNDTWLNFYRNTGLALKQIGVSCMRLDHTGKDAEKGMRGGSAKYGDVDAVWRLTRIDDETFRLDCTDNRLPIAEKQLVLTREIHPLRHTVAADGRQRAWDARVDGMIKLLDSISLPYASGRAAAVLALKEAGHKPGNTDVLAAALKRRKIANNLAPDELQLDEGDA